MGSSLRMNPHASLLETAVDECDGDRSSCREGQRPLPWCPDESHTNSTSNNQLAHWCADSCEDNRVMAKVEPERNQAARKMSQESQKRVKQ